METEHEETQNPDYEIIGDQSYTEDWLTDQRFIDWAEHNYITDQDSYGTFDSGEDW